MRMLYENELGREYFVPKDTNHLVRCTVGSVYPRACQPLADYVTAYRLPD